MHVHARSARAPRAAALLAVAAPLLAVTVPLSSPAAFAQGMCPGEPLCREVPKFSATITDFRVSPNTVGNRPVNVTVRFTNRTAQPLILGYVDGTAAAYDDRGNRYTLQSSSKLAGIGRIERSHFDPKFTLGPGESADARMELNFFVNRNVIVGTGFDVEMGVREIEPVAGGQFQLGREHALSWQHLANGSGGRAPQPAVGAIAAATSGVAGAAPAVLAEDPCKDKPACSSSGPLLAEVTRMLNEGMAGNYHQVLVTVRFRNLGNTPLILNYKQGTGKMPDNLGQPYDVSSQGTDVQGMPVSTRDRASSQFTLAPGEARDASIRFRRFAGREKQIGTSFSPSFAVEQYELLPSSQLKLVREYSLNYTDLRYGGAGGSGAVPAGAAALEAALQKLFKGDGDKKKKKNKD
jgi:hypothetical protein